MLFGISKGLIGNSDMFEIELIQFDLFEIGMFQLGHFTNRSFGMSDSNFFFIFLKTKLVI